MKKKSMLRDTVKSHLLEKIQHGQLHIGQTLNLAALSRALGISVTPIREALSQLEQARIIKAVPNRGFIVPALSMQEAEHLYKTIAELEVMALEASTFDARSIAGLKSEQRVLLQTHTAVARLESRIRFHHLLVARCPNSILTQLLRDLEARVLFYEQVFVQNGAFYEHIDNQNEAIIQAIEEDNLPTAALILKMNWMSVFEYIQKQMLREKELTYEELRPDMEQ
ncbi:GntR family transcriptional regulator [Flagellimonas sp. DF-77]|uniref:GntR family transcriptional regulator n=1 Tax=Flagellimonas algarum TaxID=3230298 RepID=UPI0033958E1B